MLGPNILIPLNSLLFRLFSSNSYYFILCSFILIFYLSYLIFFLYLLFLSLNLLTFLLNLYLIFYLSLSVIFNWVFINLSTNKVYVDSTLELPSTLLLVTIWCTCQRVNKFLVSLPGALFFVLD